MWILLYSLLILIGFIIRFIEIGLDPFDYDEYACMVALKNGFFEYIHNIPEYPLHVITYYWMSFHIFGGSIMGFRIVTLLVSMIFLISVVWCIRVFWPSDFICAFVVAVLLILTATLYI